MTSTTPGRSERGNGPERRADRRLRELTEELRVVLPGVTVLFAFLLTLPFSARFHEVSGSSRAAYLAALLCTAGAIVLLIGESAYHRLRGHPYDKQRLVRTATRQAVAAMALLAVALTLVVFVVTKVIYGTSGALAASGGVLLLAMAVWFALPLWRRWREL